MRIRFLPALILATCLLTGGLAQAQFAPVSTVSDTPALQFGQKNAQLKNILALQGQLQLLHSLIEHEQAVNEMVEAAVAIGISDPVIPKPDRELCGEVPANIPCAQAYESLYSNYSVARKKPAPIAPPPILAKIDTVVEKIAKIKPAKKTEPVIELSALYWTNITCLNNNCSAVISTDPKDPKASYRISPGEKLPDGSVIQTISAAGVTAIRNKKPVQLDPAPQA